MIAKVFVTVAQVHVVQWRHATDHPQAGAYIAGRTQAAQLWLTHHLRARCSLMWGRGVAETGPALDVCQLAQAVVLSGREALLQV